MCRFSSLKKIPFGTLGDAPEVWMTAVAATASTSGRLWVVLAIAPSMNFLQPRYFRAREARSCSLPDRTGPFSEGAEPYLAGGGIDGAADAIARSSTAIALL